MIGPREVSLTASAPTSSSGDMNTSSTVAQTRSNVRLTAKSMPSNTGGRSSKSGTAWPGTNSARWTRISIVDGAMRTRTACAGQRAASPPAPALREAAVDELDGLRLREVRVGDDHLVDAVRVEDLRQVLEPAQRGQPVV